ncbi:polysaccharide biosynthesis C-terminal domain-containing protein [Oleidesulfovibrio sp.]|uniref:oligosaccharide flippase family protein n=1 Tax=Oleidesulfovibrio sp. TaxID=2909707 RepID=UPI003A8B4D54
MSFLSALAFRIKGQGSEILRIYVLQFVTIAVGFLVSVFIARTLGPEQKGIFDLYNTILALASDASMLGISSAAFYFFTTKEINFNVVYSSSVLMAFLASSFFLILLSAVLSFFPSVLPATVNLWLLAAVLVATYLSTHSQIWSNLIVGLGKPLEIYKVNFFSTVLLLLSFLLLAVTFGLTVERVIVSCLFVGILVLGIQLYIIKQRVDISFAPDMSLFIPMIKWGGVAYVGTVVNTLHFKIDIFMVEYLCGLGGVGVYTVAVRLAEMMFILDSAVIHTSLKKIATLQREESRKYTTKISFVLLGMMSVASLAAAIIGYYFIPMLYGVSFDGAVRPFLFILPGIILWASAKPISGYICYKQGTPMIPSGFALLGVALNVCLNYYLLPVYGLTGAAIASSCSYGLVALLHVLYFVFDAKRVTTFRESS